VSATSCCNALEPYALSHKLHHAFLRSARANRWGTWVQLVPIHDAAVTASTIFLADMVEDPK